MIYKKKNRLATAFILLGMGCSLSLHAQGSRQKIFLFLSEPLREEAVTIKMEDGQEDIKHINNEQELDLEEASHYQIHYASGKHAKRSISLHLVRPGFIKLEVYDIYGKRLSTLYQGPCVQKNITIEEDESWKSFTRFRGITFFLLTVDNEVVLKKLMPKVE